MQNDLSTDTQTSTEKSKYARTVFNINDMTILTSDVLKSIFKTASDQLLNTSTHNEAPTSEYFEDENNFQIF